jgi:hypothetical protein
VGQLTITGEHSGDSPYAQVGGDGVTIGNLTTSGGYICADYSTDTSAAGGDHPVSAGRLVVLRALPIFPTTFYMTLCSFA